MGGATPGMVNYGGLSSQQTPQGYGSMSSPQGYNAWMQNFLQSLYSPQQQQWQNANALMGGYGQGAGDLVGSYNPYAAIPAGATRQAPAPNVAPAPAPAPVDDPSTMVDPNAVAMLSASESGAGNKRGGRVGRAPGGMAGDPQKAIRRATMVAKSIARDVGPIPSQPAAPAVHLASMVPGVHVASEPQHFAEGGDVGIPAFHSTNEPFENYNWQRLGQTTRKNITDANDPHSFGMALASLGPWANERDLSKQLVQSHAMPVRIGGKGKQFRSLEELHNRILKHGGAENFRNHMLRQGFGHIAVNDEEMGGKSYVALHPEAFKIHKAEGGDVQPTDDPTVQKALGVVRKVTPQGLYSQGAEAAAALPQAKGSPQQFKSTLMSSKYNVKPTEFQNSGFDEAFAYRPSVTKDEVAQHFQNAMPQIKETVLGVPHKDLKHTWIKIDQLSNELYDAGITEHTPIVRGTYNPEFYPPKYHNAIKQLADAHKYVREQADLGRTLAVKPTKYGGYTLPGGENYREVLLKSPEQEGGTFKSSHWDDPNVLAHLRLADRTGPNGEKILHVEEIQSDWGQEGRDKGFVGEPSEYKVGFLDDDGYKSYKRYKSKADAKTAHKQLIQQGKDEPFIEPVVVEGTGVPLAPYVTSTPAWTDLALKRALKEAAEGGYDKMVWTPGAEQAKRYDLSKQVSRVYLDNPVWHGDNDVRGNLIATELNGNDIISKPVASRADIEALIGKEPASKLIDDPSSMQGRTHVLEGQDLSVGGEGMKGYYDKIVPKRLQELVKKHDPEAKIETHNLITKPDTIIKVPSLKITPKMRASILKGQPAFKHGGTVDQALSLTRRYKRGGAVERHGYATDGGVPSGDDPTVQKALGVAAQAMPGMGHDKPLKPIKNPWESWKPTQYKSFEDLPVINPQDLVGKRVGSLLADLTRAGGHYSGIDSSQIENPEVMMGGPSYGILPESQLHKLAWAVQGKGKGTDKLNKNADYIAVHAMNQDSHLSNASMSNSVAKTIQAYLRDGRISPENIQNLNEMIRAGGKSKKGRGLETFPGLEHPDVGGAIKNLTFEARKKMFQTLDTAKAQKLGAPSVSKITRSTLGSEGAGVPYGHAMMLIEVPKGASQALVRLGEESGLPVHPSYDWGIHGRVVGRFAHPVAPEILHQPWFDQKNEENKTKVTAKGKPPNIHRAFEMALPATTITQDIADQLPHLPRDIQSAKAAQLALNAFNDQWQDTDTPVTKGGVGSADFSKTLRDSDSSSTLTQYSPQDINNMKKNGSFTGYKLKNGEVYFGLKRGTNYAKDYGFEHPDLTPNETSLVSVVNNEPGAKGIGGAPVVLKAIQHGATALDAYAVPTDKHPRGFLPNFYKHFGFEELGRIPFDPAYVTEQQFNDMKHEWRKTGWDEERHGLPSLAIMKWRGSDADREDAVRKFVRQGGEGFGLRYGSENVEATAKLTQQSAGTLAEGPRGGRGLGDTSGDRGAIRADNVSRPSDRFLRTLSAIRGLTPTEIPHLGLSPEDIALAKSRGLATGGTVDQALALTRRYARG